MAAYRADHLEIGDRPPVPEGLQPARHRERPPPPRRVHGRAVFERAGLGPVDVHLSDDTARTDAETVPATQSYLQVGADLPFQAGCWAAAFGDLDQRCQPAP